MLQRIKSSFLHYRTVLGVLVLMALLASAVSSATVSATEQGRAEKNIQLWIAQLTAEQPTGLRLQAQQQLEHAGDRAVDALTVSLYSSNPVLRRNAAEVLGYISTPRSVSVLHDVLAHDADPAVRTQVVWALSELNSPAEVIVLERTLLMDPDAHVRSVARDALDGLRWSIAALANSDVRSVRAMAVAPSQTDVIYMAVADQVVASRNGGKTWRTISQMPTGIKALAVSPSNPDVVYAGTEIQGIYKSRDGGATWMNLSPTLGEETGLPVCASAIAVDPQDANHIYAAKATWIGTSQARLFPLGVMESRDAGSVWTPVRFPKTQAVITRLLVDGGTLYGSADDQVMMQAQ